MAVTTTARLGLTRWSAGTDPFSRTQMDTSHANLEAQAVMYAPEGLLAARPAAGKVARLYRATDVDGGTFYWDTGTTWVPLKPDLSAYATTSSVNASLATKADKTTQIIAGTGLTGGGDLSANRTLTVAYGTTAGTAAQGNDARLSDARTPTGAAGGQLSGTYPNPSLATGTVTFAQIASAAIAASGVSSATALVRADDTRLSNARTPVAHTHTLADLPDAWVKSSVRVASTANVTIPPGGTALTIDGVALANGDRVLLKNQTTPAQNGIYVVGGIGTSVTLTRATDADTADDIATAQVPVIAGTQGGTAWVTTFKQGDTLGATAMLWYRTLDDSRLAADGGTTAGTVVQANDTRLSNARTPTGAAGGDLTGTYPNPAIAAGAVDFAMLAAATVAASGVSSATAVVRADDTRLSNARTPTGAATGDLTGTYPAPTIAAGAVTFAKIATAAVAASGVSSATALVRADDARLSDQRTPLDGSVTFTKIASAAIAASGTSSATQIVRADDTRLSNARTPVAHTHTLEDLPDAWVKRAVKAASTANVTINPGGTTFSLDGITLANGDRVLLKNQTTTSQNGIYVVGGVGSSVTLTRTTDADTASEIAGGTVSIDQGTQGGRVYSTTFKSTDTLGTTGMLWYRVTDDSLFAPNGGTTAGTLVQADDTRLSNARTPTGAAGGSLTGTYPNPTIAAGAVTFAMIASAAIAASGTSSATALVRADDTRLSNARTPTAHTHPAADLTPAYVQAADPGGSNGQLWFDTDEPDTGVGDNPTLTGLVTIGGSDLDDVKIRAVEYEAHSRSLEYGYTSGNLTSVTEKSGATTVRTITYTYSGSTLTTVTEVVNGQTITMTMNYTSGVLTSTTRSVA